MRKKIILLIISAVLCAASFTACISSSSAGMIDVDTAKKAAIVSITVGMYDRGLKWDMEDATVKKTIDSLLPMAEQQIANRWTVIPAADYITNPAYKAIQGASNLEVVIPSVNGSKSSVLAENRDQLIKSFVPPYKVNQWLDNLSQKIKGKLTGPAENWPYFVSRYAKRYYLEVTVNVTDNSDML